MNGYRVVHCIAAIGTPTVHTLSYRTAFNGYRVVHCIAAAIGTSAIYLCSHRAAADSCRVVFGIAVIGSSTVHTLLQLTAADGYRIMIGVAFICQTAIEAALYISVQRIIYQLPTGHFHFVLCHVAAGRTASKACGGFAAGDGQRVARFPLTGGVGPTVAVEVVFRVRYVQCIFRSRHSVDVYR